MILKISITKLSKEFFKNTKDKVFLRYLIKLDFVIYYTYIFALILINIFVICYMIDTLNKL